MVELFLANRARFGWLTDKSSEKWAKATEGDSPVEVPSLIACRNAESEEAQARIAGGLGNVRSDLLWGAAMGLMILCCRSDLRAEVSRLGESCDDMFLNADKHVPQKTSEVCRSRCKV